MNHTLRRITAYSAASIPAITKTAVNPGAPFFTSPAVVPSAAGVVAFASAGFFVGAGVTRPPGGAGVAAPVADAAGQESRASALRDLLVVGVINHRHHILGSPLELALARQVWRH